MTQISLSDLAQLAMDDVPELRSSTLPAGIYEFVVDDCEFTVVERTVNGSLTKIPQVNIILKVLRPLQLAAPETVEDPATLIGRKYTERFGISPDNAIESLGYLKAFLVDIGATGKGKLPEVCESSKGKVFTAPIKHTRDKHDADKVYSNLNRQRIAPVAPAAQVA